MSAMQFAKNLKRFRLVTFDITDTLLKFKEEPVKIYAQAAAKFGYRYVDERELRICFRENFKAMSDKYPNFGCEEIGWQQWWVQLVQNCFRCTNPNMDEQRLCKLADHLVNIFRTKECWKKTECCDNVLEKVHELDVPVGCISNFDPSLRFILDEMNILEHFDFVITSYEAKVQKPEAEIFNLALKRVGVEACDALHIGNSLDFDFRGAHNAGWSSILIAKNAKGTPGVKADFVYENICDMLRGLESKQIQW